jgi:hypothetical protein
MSSGRDEMMSRWSEEFQEQRLQDLAGDVDGFLQELIHTYKLPVLSAMSIVLARLVVMSKHFKLDEDFIQIVNRSILELSNIEKNESVH